MNTDWNGDGLIDERDRFAEVCNWTGATIDFDDNYWMTYNGGAYRPVQRRNPGRSMRRVLVRPQRA